MIRQPTVPTSPSVPLSTSHSTSQRAHSILDRPLSRAKSELPLSTFAWLFSELIQHVQQHSSNISQIESKLADIGYSIGLRYVDISFIRQSASIQSVSRPKSIIAMLQHIHGNVWRQLFGRAADALEKSTDNANEFYIYETAPITNRFLSVPRDMSSLNCAAFIGGIICGVMEGGGFTCDVTTHVGANNKTLYVIKVDADVMAREA